MATPKPTPTPRAADAASGGKSAQDKALGALAGVDFGAVVDPNDKSQAPVWWAEGGNTVAPGSSRAGRQTSSTVGGQTRSGVFLSREKAYAKVWEWYGTPEFDKWADYLLELGVISENERTDPNVLAEQWYDAVDTSAHLTAAGKKVKPWDAMRFISGTSQKEAAASKAGTQTSTSRSVNLTDPATARALINDVLSRQLGRAARPDEINAFTDVLHAAQQANPILSTETRTWDEAGNYTSNTSTSGGLDAAGATQVLQEQAMQSPEYGALQAGTTYFNAFNQAIQSPVPG